MSKKTSNQIYCGDNLEIMYNIEKESVDLIYLDPPFFSGKNYEVIWGDNAEIRSFEDRFEGGIMVYVEWMKDRLVEMHRILKSDGSIYLHCDHHAVHYLKVEMDKIFGINNFNTQITWRRSGSKGNAKMFANNSDYILFYSKNKTKVTFNIQYGDYSETTKKMFKYDDNDGKGFYKQTDVSAPSGKGNKYVLGYGEKQPSGGYRWKKETMLQKIDEGLVIVKRGKVPAQKRYLNDGQGVPFDNVWTDIENVKSPIYPTQKPEKLLERIIKSSSNPGDILFDPFCGCGTSAVVAEKLKRRYIGIDISETACKVIISRLKSMNIDEVLGLPRTVKEISAIEKPHEFQNWVCKQMEARNTSPNPDKPSGADGGIDGILHTPLTNLKYHGSPIQVKQSKNVGINTVRNFFAAMHDVNKKIGFIVALSFGSGAKEQVAKYKNEGSVLIHLLTVDDIIDATDFNDIVKKLK